MAGSAYGRLLAYLDAATLAEWTGGAGLRARLARWYARRFGFPELAAHRRFPLIQEALDRLGGRVVLDLGAGSGLYSLADAIRRPGSVHLLADVSFRHMRRASVTGRALGLPVGAVVCRAEAIPLASGCIDTAVLIEVLQFVDDDERAVEEVARVLRPGGLWLCEQERVPAGTPWTYQGEGRLRKRRAGYVADALRDLAARRELVLETSVMVTGPAGRRWERLDGRIFGRSRALHLVLFPLLRLLARLSMSPSHGHETGTVLYCFRKPGGRSETAVGGRTA